jgi:hypothetical protein
LCFQHSSILLLGVSLATAQDVSQVPTSSPQSYRAGKKSLVIPPPATELYEIGSDYRVTLETIVPASNRLIAAFIRPDELNAVLAPGERLLSRYALVQVPRGAEFVDVNGDDFKKVAGSVAEQFGANLDTLLKDEEADLNRRLKAVNSGAAAINLDKPTPLGSLFSKPDASGFAMIVPVSTKGTTTRMVMGLSVLRVQNRLLFAYLYSAYKDDESVQWVRRTSEQWADAILAANKQ